MAKLEKMEELLSNAGGEKRYVDGFRNGTIWAYNEAVDFLKTYLQKRDYTYIDNNNVTDFLFDFRNYLTDKNTK